VILERVEATVLVYTYIYIPMEFSWHFSLGLKWFLSIWFKVGVNVHNGYLFCYSMHTKAHNSFPLSKDSL
jgi:hypothetical protein